MITLYLYDNIIQYKEKEEIKECPLSEEALEYGRIKNITLFETQLEKLAKQKKWLSLFKSKKIQIILPFYYSDCDKEVLTVILQNIGFQNIKLKKEGQCINLKKYQIICNIHKKYLVLYKFQKEPMLYPFYLFSGMKNTLEFILKKNSRKFQYILIGNNPKIIEYAEQKKDSNICYYQECKEYIIKQRIPD